MLVKSSIQMLGNAKVKSPINPKVKEVKMPTFADIEKDT
jgi:hypothetical protein